MYIFRTNFEPFLLESTVQELHGFFYSQETSGISGERPQQSGPNTPEKSTDTVLSDDVSGALQHASVAAGISVVQICLNDRFHHINRENCQPVGHTGGT